jgi:tripeptidyl-peptidase-1
VVSNLPAVISISYGWNEVAFPVEYLRRQCIEFLKLGLQGVTVIVASSDYGAAGQHGSCLENGQYILTTPSDCPYVTSVGATQLSSNTSNQLAEEIPYVRQNGNRTSSSGGGFSNVFNTASYQRSATHRYIQDLVYNSSMGSIRVSQIGRGVPDVAAIGKNYVTVVNGLLKKVHGTSASAPVVASIAVLLNDKRLRTGKGTVGFLNPLLYRHPWALNDINKGENYGCGGEKAFAARPGWDPVTGLGTPDFERLWRIYERLP